MAFWGQNGDLRAPGSSHRILEEDRDEHNEFVISSAGRGIKVAEGGRYDDLVRRYRPPGNFGSAIFNHYTTVILSTI